ncbi:hypothetical protein BKA70DRAFT_1344053 [Coprinopsis sp. MPI-PUGE-AT-0042]|nr:hypothetical protein BKA70DRAFT_1344053 [Coprinopsis sp. MPI-PUGE-AT-0042]
MDQAMILLCWALHLIGCFIFAFMLVSAILFASTVKRHPIWYNFCLSFIVSSLPYSLLAFVGEREDPLELPKRRLCIAQAVLIYAAPFLAPSASVVMVVLLLLNILSTLSGGERETPPIILVVSLVSPWVLWAGALSWTITFILRDITSVRLSVHGTVCMADRSLLPKVAGISAAVFGVTLLALESVIFYLLFKHRALKGVFAESIAMAVRISVFTGVAVIAAVTGLVFAGSKSTGGIPYVMIATVPFTTAITFATQRDLWERYMFWRKPPESEQRQAPISKEVAVISVHKKGGLYYRDREVITFR